MQTHYPKQINLKYPEIEAIVSTDAEDMTPRIYSFMANLPADTLSDLQQLILREIGRQHGKDSTQLAADTGVNGNIIANALRFSLLYTPYTKDTEFLKVILEILRQTDDIIDYNLGENHGRDSIFPAMWHFCYAHPAHLKPYLLERSLYHRGKEIALEWLGTICASAKYGSPQNEAIYKESDTAFREILEAYIDDFNQRETDEKSHLTTIEHSQCASVYYPQDNHATLPQQMADKEIMSILVGEAAPAGADSVRPFIPLLYRHHLIDEEICGPEEDVMWTFSQHWQPTLPELNPFSLFFSLPADIQA